jgi:S-adenosylmethionine synthetase
VSDEAIVEAVRAVFSLTPKGIIDALDLRKPIYSPTAAYGHFGRSPRDVTHTTLRDGKPSTQTNAGFTWERTDKAEALARHAGR